jgi:galactoside O-acetyltransferase
MSLFEAAITDIERGNYESAKATLDQLHKTDSLNPQVNHALGIVNLRMGLVEEATSSLLASLAASPNNTDVARTLYIISKSLGDSASAKSIVDLILESDPSNSEFQSLKREIENPTTARRTPFFGSWLECQDYVDVHASVILGPSSSVSVPFRPTHPGIKISVGEHSQIFGSLTVQRPDAFIKVGARTQIGSSTLIASKGISIGDDVLMAWGITIMDNDSHSLFWEERARDVIQCGFDHLVYPQDFCRNKDWSNVKAAPIVIEDKVWIGFGASVLKGVTIGEGAVIGANSVVTKDVEPWTLVAGNPARPIRKLSRSRDV